METWRETRMLGYDTVVAVTQNNINSHFKRIFGTPGGIKRDLSIGNKRIGFLNSAITAPTVRLRAGNEYGTVRFTIVLQKGELQYYKGDSDELSRQAIDGWRLAFKVKLDVAKVEQASVPGAVLDAVKRRLPDGTIDPAIFSFRQLFMYFENVVAMEAWEAFFPKEVADPNDPRRLADSDLETALVQLMNAYLLGLRKEGHHILGYAITVDNPNRIPALQPTFPPTDITFVVNTFEGAGNEDGGLDTFCYAMVTDKRVLPAANPLQRFGNWVTDSKDYGTIAVAKTLFVDRYLIQRLAEALTLRSEFNLWDGTADIEKVSYKSSLRTISGEGKFVPGSLGAYGYHSESEKSIDLPGPGWTQVHTWKASHDTEITIPPGGQKVEVNGSTTIRADCVHWHGVPNSDWTAKTTWWRQSKTSWKLSIELRGVTRGVLKVELSPTRDEFLKAVANPVYSEDGDLLYKMGKWLAELFSKQFDNFKEVMADEFQQIYSRVDDLSSRVERRLNSMNMFVFPGGAEFTMKDPRFNNELDLLAGTEWEFH